MIMLASPHLQKTHMSCNITTLRHSGCFFFGSMPAKTKVHVIGTSTWKGGWRARKIRIGGMEMKGE